MIATRLVWETAGRPAPAAASVAALLVDSPAQCAMCGEETDISAHADKALGQNFSDRSHLRYPGGRICPACLWCCSGKPPATLRMWSIICAPGVQDGAGAGLAGLRSDAQPIPAPECHPTPGRPSASHVALPASNPKAWLQVPGVFLHNRAAAGVFGRFLADPPDGDWALSIALSGQKHVLPYADVNHGQHPWRVRVEDHHVTSTPTQWAQLRTHALALRGMGIPEPAVLNGSPDRIRDRAQLAEWAHHNHHLSTVLGSPLLRLCLWTITREELQ